MSFNHVFRNICYYWNVLEYLLSDAFGLLGWYTYSWTLLVLKLPTVVLGLKMLKHAWDLSYLNIKVLGHIMAILHSRGDRGCPIRSGPIIWHFVEPKKRRETRESQLSTCESVLFMITSSVVGNWQKWLSLQSTRPHSTWASRFLGKPGYGYSSTNLEMGPN